MHTQMSVRGTDTLGACEVASAQVDVDKSVTWVGVVQVAVGAGALVSRVELSLPMSEMSAHAHRVLP